MTSLFQQGLPQGDGGAGDNKRRNLVSAEEVTTDGKRMLVPLASERGGGGVYLERVTAEPAIRWKYVEVRDKSAR